MKSTETAKWELICNLSEIQSNFSNVLLQKQGVYVWVSNTHPKRIIYVGEVHSEDRSIGQRNCEHISNLLQGSGTIFIMDPNNDPYIILSKSIEEIRLLEKENRFHYPDLKNKKSVPTWVPNYVMTFLSQIELWVCPIEKNNKPACELLEGLIIEKIKKNPEHPIKSWRTNAQDSWVGRRMIAMSKLELFLNSVESTNTTDFIELLDNSLSVINSLTRTK